MPYVGGVDTIRSFDEFRFKDENALWMSAEYRWQVMKYASVATFVDAGKVERDWQDLTFTGHEDRDTASGFARIPGHKRWPGWILERAAAKDGTSS